MLQPSELAEEGAPAEVLLTGADAHHIHRVLRLRPGEEIEVSCQGRTYVVRLTRTSPAAVQGRVVAQVKERREPRARVILAQALLKGEKMEWVIQKGTELGVKGFIALEARRAVVQLAPEKAAQRRERWQRIAREAAQQCGRPLVPFVAGPLPLQQVIESADYAPCLKLLAWEGEEEVPLHRALAGGGPEAGVVVFIGPEGGFTVEEVNAARRAGAQPVSLGPRILRAETAALAAVTAVLYSCGELG
ncbi:MAG: 16S rRNA (uracil(1498)-N(3))-methyltransferase [Bacillota bacterium]|nr:16S rRNA (uracil(1498)-N(3))-methyltransferase [Bacillota bacterium]